MKKLVLYIGIFTCLWFTSCTKNNYYDSGISNGRHDCSLLEYMEQHGYDWDSTVLMVRHAGADMVQLFEGKDLAHPEITFLGPTNHSIRRYLLRNGYESIRELDPAWCKKILLQHIIDGKHMMKDIPAGEEIDGSIIGKDGKIYSTLNGNRVWMCTYTEDYNGVMGLGLTSIHLSSIDGSRKIQIGSSNIEPNNCVVHSLHYSFTLGQMVIE